MKTPYDTALRVAERKLDEVRRAIAGAADMLGRIDAARQEADAALLTERGLAGSEQFLRTEPYFVVARARRAALDRQHEQASQVLQALRARAVECFGERTALDTAATRFREEAERAAAAAEQAAIDDLTGARFRRVRRRTARALPPRDDLPA